MDTQKPTGLPNNYISTPTGILTPPGYGPRSFTSKQDDYTLSSYSYFCQEGFSYGTRIPRDPDTLVMQFAPKGSGIDDLLMAAIADGTVANIGIAPVVWDQLSALIKRRQEQINSVSVVVTGRSAPATRATNALARMADSPLGIIDGLKQVLYQLDVFNRGAPMATLPITLPIDQWDREGMTLRPILDNTGKASRHFYLEVNWQARTPVPYLPSIWRLEPTGDPLWPFWYRITIDNKPRWVLLHQSQIMPHLQTLTNKPGIGTSPIWLCLPAIAEHTLVIDERYEKLIDKPTQGILGISGVQQGAPEIRNTIDSPDQTWTLLASPNKISFDGWSFRQPDTVDPIKRQEHYENILAAAFNEHLSSVVIRGGVGYGVQGGIAADNSAENGVFAVLQAMEVAFGAIYPRVSIRVTKTNDRARRLGLELLAMFTTSIAALPLDTLSREEIRAIIDREYLTIPATDNTIQSDARPGNDAENKDQAQLTAEILEECRAFLHDVINTTPEAQFQQAILAARTITAGIRPEQWITSLLDMARRFHLELHTP